MIHSIYFHRWELFGIYTSVHLVLFAVTLHQGGCSLSNGTLTNLYTTLSFSLTYICLFYIISTNDCGDCTRCGKQAVSFSFMTPETSSVAWTWLFSEWMQTLPLQTLMHRLTLFKKHWAFVWIERNKRFQHYILWITVKWEKLPAPFLEKLLCPEPK